MTPFLTYEPPKVSVFLALVTGLVTDLDSLVTDPVLALALRNRMYLSSGWPCNIYLHIYKVFECHNMLWMGIWVHPYTVIPV